MKKIISYILRFMTGEQLPEEALCLVGYTSDTADFSKYKVVILPSHFFDDGIYGTAQTKPALPLQQIEGVPFLFGTPKEELLGDTLVVHADLVASAFFLLSRYEEMIHREIRDEHGRFPGRESLPYKAGFIDRPIVEEYGKLIRNRLRLRGVSIEEPPPAIRRINLTHDVDEPFYCRTWRNVGRLVLAGRNPFKAIRHKYGEPEKDPYYTFPWLLQQDKILQHEVGEDRCQVFFFFKAGGHTKQDKPYYDLGSIDMLKLLTLCLRNESNIGLHCSYEAGIDPSLIVSEKINFEEKIEMVTWFCRHHFLASREPEDMEYLPNAGIFDDFTIGYADVAGFRLGTSLPVYYINPVTRRLSKRLLLHPLIIMDSTLSDAKYMNLTADKAEAYCLRLINNIRQVNGELTLLWHNTSVARRSGYLRELYRKLLISITE